MITLQHHLVLSALLFVIGACGAATRRGAAMMLMSILVMLSAAAVSMVAFARWTLLPQGHVAAIFVLVVFATYCALGIAIGIRSREKG